MYLAMNTILYCRRWDETVRFYRDRLGLGVTLESDWLVEFEVSEGGRLSVADERRARVRSAGGAGITVTLRVADADAEHARLARTGIELEPVRAHPWSARLFRFHDPEGNRLEVWSPLG